MAFFPSVLQGILPRIIPRARLVKNPEAGLFCVLLLSSRFSVPGCSGASRSTSLCAGGARWHAQGTRASDCSHLTPASV